MSEHLIRRATSIKAVVLLAAVLSISNCSPVGNPKDYSRPPTPNANAAAKTTTPDLFKSRSDYTNSIGMEFMKVPAGSFMMGGPRSEKPYFSNDYSDEPVHQVTINNSFYLGKYEVTQEQYENVTGNNPSKSDECVDFG